MTELTLPTLPGYRLVEPIGTGARGAVYRAIQTAVGREVAVKIIPPHLAGRPEFIRRFDLEAQRIARLEHLHVVPLTDFWRDPNGAYLVMRWLRGGSLAERLRQGPLDLEAAVRLVEQAAGALAAAHAAQIVHQNVKPSNLLFDEEGNAYLSDFAIAVSPGPPPADGGPAGYLAPEQVRGLDVSPRTDLYSLGLVLFEALSGRHPLAESSPVERLYQQLDEPLPSLEGLEPAVAAAVDEVIRRATAKDPARRYDGAPEMAATLRTAAQLDRGEANLLLEENLTRRELEILAHIVEGHSNKQIASALFIELSTVKWHITTLYRKMGVRSRRQAAVRGRELQLADVGREEPARAAAGAILARPLNPYKGLRPFAAADSREFFGREALVRTLLERLQEPGGLSRFLALVGPSGSGKSSLLHAGLGPALRAGKLPGSDRWYVVEMTPGARPLDELEVALTRLAAEQAGNLREHLRRDAGGLLRAAGLILPGDGSELCLLIDQFEELFLLTGDETIRTHFLDLLHQAAVGPHSRVRIVAALRADFYDRPLLHPGFGGLMRGRTETVLPLAAEELERAIVEPAALAGVEFEPGLPTRIVEEMLYQPGALPLLQYALTELFEERRERLLTHEAYEVIGGGIGALARRAEEIYLGLDEQAQAAARQMCLRLVHVGSRDGEGAPAQAAVQPVARAELLSLTADPDLMDEVVETFGAYRLLSLDRDRATRQPAVRLAHEALVREWARCRRWIEESEADLRRHHRLQQLVAEWEQAGRDPGYLLRQARLDQLAAWAAGSSLHLTPAEQRFLDASLEARAGREEKEEERRRRELETARRLAATEKRHAARQRAANRRLKMLTAGLAVILLVALGAALFAWTESRRASAQARVASARELAARAVGSLDGDPDLSLLLALEAVESTYRPDGLVLPAAEEALHQAIQESRVLLQLPRSGGVAFSPDGAYLIAGSADGTVVAWDRQAGRIAFTFDGHAAAVTDVAVSPDGRILASIDAGHSLILRRFPTGGVLAAIPGPADAGEGPGRLVFSPDGSSLLTTGPSVEARIREMPAGRERLHFDESAGPTAAFSPDGRRLALMTAVWELPPAAPAGEQEGPAVVTWEERLFDYGDTFLELAAASSEIESVFAEPGSVSFSPDGTRLLTAVVSTVAVMRDARTGERLFTLNGHANLIHDSAFDPSGALVATAAADRTARLWEAATGRLLLTLEGHRGEVVALAFSPDGRQLATGSVDGTTRLWDLTLAGRGEWPAALTYPGLGPLNFQPGRAVMLASEPGQNARLVDLDTGRTVRDLPGLPAGLTFYAFDGAGDRLAAAGAEGTVAWLDLADPKRIQSAVIGRTISYIAYGPRGRRLILGSGDGRLIILDLSTGEVLGQWQFQEGFINGIVPLSGPERLAVAGADGTIVVVDLERLLAETDGGFWKQLSPGVVRWAADGHADVITHLASSPNGAQLLTSSWDGTARLWDAVDGAPLLTLAGHAGWVWQAAFAPDGERIATAGADGNVILWDARTGEQRLRVGSGLGEVRRLGFSGDGRFLAAATADGAVSLFVMPIDDLLALARRRLTRDFTAAECRRFLDPARCP